MANKYSEDHTLLIEADKKQRTIKVDDGVKAISDTALIVRRK